MSHRCASVVGFIEQVEPQVLMEFTTKDFLLFRCLCDYGTDDVAKLGWTTSGSERIKKPVDKNLLLGRDGKPKMSQFAQQRSI